MVADMSDRNLPWVEKYRPTALDELISHQDIISTINRFIDSDQLPHLLLYGPPGTGKTTTVLACARRLYTPSQLPSMLLELNASDERGIGVVREQILTFASTRVLAAGGATDRRLFKMIVLDEADAMTRDAQNALRRIIEKFTDNVRFCLICNYLSKIIPAVQSRCTRFRFAPLAPDQMLPRLRLVARSEKSVGARVGSAGERGDGLSVRLTEDGETALLTLSRGDMRRVLNTLQSTAMAFDVVDEPNVYACVGHPQKADMDAIVDWLLNQPFSAAYQRIQDLKITKGLALVDIITEVHYYVMRLVVPASVQALLIERMAELEYRLSEGASERLQLSALVAAFLFARQLIAEEPRRVDV